MTRTLTLLPTSTRHGLRSRGSQTGRKQSALPSLTRMFELAPDAWTVFPWGKGMMSEEISQNEQFLKFAANFVGMLDMAIDMLGPDMELVEEQLFHLGVSHIDFGVTPQHYPLMGRALMDTFEATLGKERFSARQKASWQSIYQFMSTTMMEGAFDGLKKSARIY